GPMTTQTLRGMANDGPMHWRGDRSGANNPGGSALDENAAFNRFIVAFDGLLGRGTPDPAFTTADMQSFSDFILPVMLPPHPGAQPGQQPQLRPVERAGHLHEHGPHERHHPPLCRLSHA